MDLPHRMIDLPGPLALYQIGTGPPLVVLPGLDRRSEPPSPAGLQAAARRFGSLAHITCRTVCLLERPRGLRPAVTMPEIASLHAAALRHHFGVPVDIMGASTGGAVSLQIACDHPHVVRRLVVVCAAAWLGDVGRRKLAQFAREVASGRSGALVLASVLAGPIARWPMSLLLWASSLFERRIDPTDMLAMIHAECGFDARGSLASVSAPTLLIGGEIDRAFPRELLRETAASIPHSQLILYPRRGHIGAMMDRRFGPDIAKFFNEPTSAPCPSNPSQAARIQPSNPPPTSSNPPGTASGDRA